MEPSISFAITEKLFPSTLTDVCSATKGLNEVEKIFYKENIVLTSVQATKLCQLTVLQNNSHWYNARQPRITASEAHKIVKARTPHTRLKYFAGNQSSIPLENFKYGHEMEGPALKKYEEVTNNKVSRAGIVVKLDQCYLGASPDGLVIDENDELIVVEVKCPISCKDKKIVVEYLTVTGTRPLTYGIDKKHPYFTQVQLLMHCCGAKKCHFFVYSSADYTLVPVDYDETYV